MWNERCHRDEIIGLLIYLSLIIAVIVILFAFDYQMDVMELLLLLIFIVPFIIELLNRVNRPCPVGEK